MHVTQLLLAPAPRRHEANLTRRYPIEHASWIWHPDCKPGESCFLRFELAFVADGSAIRIHVSADQTLALYCDDVLVMRGPASSTPEYWAFHTYDLLPAPGLHRLRAEVWHLADNLSPGQRLSVGGGFILASEGPWHPLLSTGHAPWTLVRRRDAEPLPPVAHLPVYIGCGMRWRLGHPTEPAITPAITGHWWDNLYGMASGLLKLEPVEIPDPRESLRADFKIVAIIDDWLEPGKHIPKSVNAAPLVAPVTTPPFSTKSILVDLGTYLCGWPELSFQEGAGATIECQWAESLLDSGDLTLGRHPKGDRSEVEGKHFLGFGDAWVTDGAPHTVSTHWWRAGRYVLIRVRTESSALVLESLRVRATGYPWPCDSAPLHVGDGNLQAILRLGWNGFAACTHDLFLDCPFYEQMQYAADTRVMILVSYVCTGDERLARRAIAQFDRSRKGHGLPAMRTPSRNDMVSTTFALWWIGMVADFARWRRDRAFVAARLEGIRSTLDQLDAYRNGDGLLEAAPGWSFVDWGTPWDDPAHPECFNGIPPGARGGVSALINLHDALAREQAAQLEDYAGLPALALHRRDQAAKIRAACRRFIDPETGLVRDADGQKPFSEHAQIFALLAGLFEPHETTRPLAALHARSLPARASIYFLHHLFEVFTHHRCASTMNARLDPWRDMLARNLTTPIEEPEPSRSDCHGWGGHPLFHAIHGVLGLQPEGMEFRRAFLRPDLGSLPFVEATIPHHDGTLRIRVERKSARTLHVQATIPGGLRISLADGRELVGGTHSLEFPSLPPTQA